MNLSKSIAYTAWLNFFLLGWYAIVNESVNSQWWVWVIISIAIMFLAGGSAYEKKN